MREANAVEDKQSELRSPIASGMSLAAIIGSGCQVMQKRATALQIACVRKRKTEFHEQNQSYAMAFF
jgi:hypothetical protein